MGIITSNNSASQLTNTFFANQNITGFTFSLIANNVKEATIMTHKPMNSRKRGRSNCEEECCVPLSKRINNLHINKNSCCNGLVHSEHPIPQNNESTYLERAAAWTTPGAGATSDGLTATAEAGTSAVWHPPYSPDLDATDNPFYYHNNKLLYELYVQRLQRGGLM